jgi:Flp pilus assembly protein TadG
VFGLKRGLKKLLQEQGGSSIVLVGLTLLVLLAAMALVVDGGTVLVERSHLQKTANAAVLSGAQELTHQQAAVTGVIQTILQRHEEAASLQSSAINMGQNVTVQLTKTVSLGFSKLLGMDTVTVAANAAAQITPIGSATGAAPLGIDDSIVLQFGQQYELKVDQTGVVSGYFGILALGGSGAKTYEDNLMHGYSNVVQVGDIIDTQTGNIAGDTRDAVQYRINSSPYPPGDITHGDDPRILLVPVYKPYDFTSNQMKQIQVTGFAYFYISEPMDSNDTSITGMFIKKTGAGTAKPGASDRGAYTIRLTE